MPTMDDVAEAAREIVSRWAVARAAGVELGGRPPPGPQMSPAEFSSAGRASAPPLPRGASL
jgi:hypothetical protein